VQRREKPTNQKIAAARKNMLLKIVYLRVGFVWRCTYYHRVLAQSDKILESLASGTKTKATVTSQYLNTTAQSGKCHQASYTNSRLRTAIHRIPYPVEEL
jgi:hypothetical protein